FDPTNGYTAIHATALRALDLTRVRRRYFFESDMLVQLSGVRALVGDVPMDAVYGDEKSGIKIIRVIPEFAFKHAKSYIKRIIYNYFLRDFNMASLHLIFGTLLFLFGAIFGGISWARSIETGVPATTGTVMVAALAVLLGFQMLLFFLSFDIANEPRIPLQRRMAGLPVTR
ncbi:MAG: glycosyltransferase family 2 protein, partial [Alphaproteobacteria bacterium]